MIQKIWFVVLLVVAGGYFLATSPAQNQQADTSRPTTWRHLALSDAGQSDAELARKINQLGDDGWELVDVETYPEPDAKIKTVYYFKKTGEA